MLISGVVVETIAGRASTVATRLARIDGLDIAGSDGDHKLAAVWCCVDAAALQLAATKLLDSDADIVGIYPTFIGNE